MKFIDEETCFNFFRKNKRFTAILQAANRFLLTDNKIRTDVKMLAVYITLQKHTIILKIYCFFTFFMLQFYKKFL